MIPYYDDGARIIYHADNRYVLPYLADIDLVFTSPPDDSTKKSYRSVSPGHRAGCPGIAGRP